MAGDDDKTVFGEEFPDPAPRRQPQQPHPHPQHPQQQQPPQPPGQGQQPSQQPPFTPPPQSPPGYGQPPPQGAPAPPAGWGPPPPGPAATPPQNTGGLQSPPGWGGGQAGGYRPNVVHPQSQPQPLFHSTPPPEQPRDSSGAPVRARLSMKEALQSAEDSAAGSSNPIVAEISALLILLGRLRSGLVTLEIGPLMNYVDRDLRSYPNRLHARGVNDQDARDALFAVAALADDIVQNLPSPDRGIWNNQPMVARFFGTRNPGVDFFTLVHQALRTPGQRADLLELLYVCLSLGFEGQYRGVDGGRARVDNERRAIYATLRQVQRRFDEDLSPRWRPVTLAARRRSGQIPLIAIAGACAAALVLAVGVTTYINDRYGRDIETTLQDLHRLPDNRALAEVRTVPVSFDGLLAAVPAAPGPEPVDPGPTQLERLRGDLGPPLDSGAVAVVQEGDYIKIRLVGAQFATNSAELSADFSSELDQVAAAIDGQPGPIQVLGFTDNRGSEQINNRLSQARATTVLEALRGQIADADRMTAVGRGSEAPLLSNSTPEGRAANRRVEIWLTREELL
jgi:type VI secretion system protein ImpK